MCDRGCPAAAETKRAERPLMARVGIPWVHRRAPHFLGAGTAFPSAAVRDSAP